MISVAAARSLGPIVPIHTVILWSLLRAAGGVKFLMKKALRDVVFGCGRSADDRSEGLPPQISTKSPWSRALTSDRAARPPKRRHGALAAAITAVRVNSGLGYIPMVHKIGTAPLGQLVAVGPSGSGGP